MTVVFKCVSCVKRESRERDSSSLSLVSFSSDPATCPIVPGQETVIEISKGRSGLGLSIVGGKDTQLVRYKTYNVN